MASPAAPPHVPLISPTKPVVSPVYDPLAVITWAERHVECWLSHSGLSAQSGSLQSVKPSRSSSRPLPHSSAVGAQLGANRQVGSAQSMAPLQSSSAPLSQ